MEQLVARRAHNPKVVWFESHSRYLRTVNRLSFFLFCRTATVLPRSMRSALFQVNLTIHHLLNNAKRYLQNNVYGSASVDGGCADNLCLLLVYDFTKRYPRELGHFVPDLRVPLPLLKGETKVSPFFVAGVMCYLSPKPPFCKGGLFIHSASSTTNLQFSMKLL